MKTKVLISILNWNKAEETLACLSSLETERTIPSVEVTVQVIDNGSRSEEVSILKEGLQNRNILLLQMTENLGFTGGHNISMQKAIDENFDFVWLLNNDATVAAGTLEKLLDEMSAAPKCGAVSPIIRDTHDDTSIEGCVNLHDWKLRRTNWLRSVAESKVMQDQKPESIWLIGTAILFRVEALRQTGLLDNRLFAYYDDNDIGVRLAAAGWHSRCAFDASVFHAPKEPGAQRPLYYHYLMQRNQMLFWHKNTPQGFRRFLWLKLLDTALHNSNRLRQKGMQAQADVVLLGAWDFIQGKFGAPVLERRVPLFLRLASKASAVRNRKLLAQQAMA